MTAATTSRPTSPHTPTPAPPERAARPDAGRGLLFGATILSGLAAGFFYTYEASVTLGLAEVDSITYVETFQAINDTIRNPVFGLVFFGSLPALAVAAAVNWRTSAPIRRALLLLAPMFYLTTMAITFVGNVPLNDELGEIEPTTTAIADAARDDFEDDWNRLNLIRTVTAFGSFVTAAGALSFGAGRSERLRTDGFAAGVGQTG